MSIAGALPLIEGRLPILLPVAGEAGSLPRLASGAIASAHAAGPRAESVGRVFEIQPGAAATEGPMTRLRLSYDFETLRPRSD